MTETESRPARRTGRPPLTDRATLLAAARELGFTELTVGAVTARVGVKYSTFYRHFPSLEALVAALVDDVLTDDVFPAAEGTWQDYLLAFAGATFDVMADNPGLAPALVRLPDAPEAVLTAFRALTDELLAAGFSPEDALLGAGTTVQMGIQPWLTTTGQGSGESRRLDEIVESEQPFDQRIRTAFREQVDDPPRRWTLRRVELMIAGLETRLAA